MNEDRWADFGRACDLCAGNVTAASAQSVDRTCVCGRNLALFADEIALAEKEQADKRRTAIAALVAQTERNPRIRAARARVDALLAKREKTA